jgi:hypothetical protein
MSDNRDPVTEELAIITEIGWWAETCHLIQHDNSHAFITPERILDI